MKIDFNQVFKNLEGEVIKDSKSGKELTLGRTCAEALLSADNNIDGLEKMKRYELAKKIYNNEVDSLTAEEIVLIKEMTGKVFLPLLVGQIYQMLDIT